MITQLDEKVWPMGSFLGSKALGTPHVEVNVESLVPNLCTQ